MRAPRGNVDTIRGGLPVRQAQRLGVDAISALCRLATIKASCRVTLDAAIGQSSPQRPQHRFGIHDT
jgi:hypothetical protein